MKRLCESINSNGSGACVSNRDFTEISPSNRYYYAIVECDSVEAASHLYDELEATELERSANVFDLSFVPDDMKFDGEFRYTILHVGLFAFVAYQLSRDEATGDLNAPYNGLEFVTDVRCTILVQHPPNQLTLTSRHFDTHESS